MKIVLDTNVIVSAIFFGGKPRQLLEMVLQKMLKAFVTVEIINEYKDTFEYLINKYPNQKIQISLTDIFSEFYLIETQSNIKVCRNPDDNKFISCAVDAKCIYIVSGIPDIYQVWDNEGWNAPVVEESYNPDRTQRTLFFTKKQAIKTEGHKARIREFLMVNKISKTVEIAEFLGLSVARTRTILSGMDDIEPIGENKNRKYTLKALL